MRLSCMFAWSSRSARTGFLNRGSQFNSVRGYHAETVTKPNRLRLCTSFRPIITFTVSDDLTAAGDLQVTATSSNQSMVHHLHEPDWSPPLENLHPSTSDRSRRRLDNGPLAGDNWQPNGASPDPFCDQRKPVSGRPPFGDSDANTRPRQNRPPPAPNSGGAGRQTIPAQSKRLRA